MQAKWILNGLDVSLWLRENGVAYSEIHRQSRSVITLDGTLEQAAVIKRGLTLDFMTLGDKKLAELEQALETRPVTLIYTEKKRTTATKLFYVTAFDSGVKTVRGGNTYWSGVRLGLEER